MRLKIDIKDLKNKLTHTIRICKKDYFRRKLDDNKNNVKGTWDTLKRIIKSVWKQQNPEYSIDKGNAICNNESDVADNLIFCECWS